MSQHPLIKLIRPGQQQHAAPCMPNTSHNSSHNATSTLPASASFNIGNGFIEIAALTSLIGSATAQTLALGNKGPAGLVWATMTIFGSMSVVRAGIATVTPGWLRDSLGVRSPEADAAVGLSLDLNAKGMRYRSRAGVAKGVLCQVTNLDQPLEIGRRDVQVFDQRTTNVLTAIPSAESGNSLKVYSYCRDPFYTETRSHQAWVDWTCLLVSAVKLIEVFALKTYGADMLAWVTFVTWLIFFLAGIVLKIHDHVKERLRARGDTVLDTIASNSLPIPSSAGGARKVLIGIPAGDRGDAIWKVIWALSSIICATSVIFTYMALGDSLKREVFFIWSGFQVLWIVLRSTFFHLVDDRERPYLASLEGKLWKDVKIAERLRVRNLVLALAKYQYHIHPRGPWSYNEDMELMPKLDNVRTVYPLAAANVFEIQVNVVAVIGDTLLSSVSWTFGCKKGGFDFYDTCIVIVLIKDREVAIPAARVLSASRQNFVKDPEQGNEIERPPRGSSNIGLGIEWWFWVPCGENQWLYFNSEQLKFKGTRQAQLLTDAQVTQKLENGELYISLKEVSEIKETVKTSTQACGYLLELLA